MKAQMRFQKIICLVMILVGALSVLYALLYCSGAVSELGQSINTNANGRNSAFRAKEGYNDAMVYEDISGFNDILLIIGIVMILLAVVLYVTSCNRRRNYYVSNYVAIGLCAGGDVVLSLICMIMNASWKKEFLNVDFEAWYNYNQGREDLLGEWTWHYSDSTLWFDLGFVVYAIIIVASLVLIFNLIWKILLMKGEKKLLQGNQLAGGEVV